MKNFSKFFLKVLYCVKVGGKCLYSERIYSSSDNAKNKAYLGCNYGFLEVLKIIVVYKCVTESCVKLVSL